MGDPDNNLRDFRLVTVLLAIGAALYFIPYLVGVQGAGIATGTMANISNFLVTNTNPNWAVGIGYVATALFAIMGAAGCHIYRENRWTS